MGVPALFRWLSKKYPKIIQKVIEDQPVEVPTGEFDEDGKPKTVSYPVDITKSNPNGQEFDNLYLDMNGIVHPCTHPEGKPAPETEEDMMLEIFEYTERVFNMIRPRKLLFMAIDGVAPRAKMNQQRSRRFRSSREAAEKEEERKEAIRMFREMGQEVSEETANKKSWDSNAITPGTPFMALLAASLRYWVVQKMATDPAWKNIQVIISDASVPGEGEHKIMDFIRRQRVNKGHDPNTEHVIYGLDADLIMLALATHEPRFKVLREDVFYQPPGGGGNGCRKCGQEGHYAAQCTGAKQLAAATAPKPEKKAGELKPFLFLDVAVLREYLEIDLNVTNMGFPFDLERAMDDWVFLIFFVGNDFLPHLPSLEIREGAIDTLLKIWKNELANMGGYVTNHGRLELERVQVILDALASREDDIFRKRREDEERQEANNKRRRIENDRRNGIQENAADIAKTGPDSRSTLTGMQMNGDDMVLVTPSRVVDTKAVHASLPSRPAFDLVPAVQPPAKKFSHTKNLAVNMAALGNEAAPVKAGGSFNKQLAQNKKKIEEANKANLSAAERLKAELLGSMDNDQEDKIEDSSEDIKMEDDEADADATEGLMEIAPSTDPSAGFNAEFDAAFPPPPVEDADATDTLRGVKRKLEDDDESGTSTPLGTDLEEDPPVVDAGTAYMDKPIEKSTARKVNPDGTVDQEDTVKLWEPGYRERYYREKFHVELSDLEFRKSLTKSYVEGLSWVLHYYYQGAPSWQWYYPHHFAPFAADFKEVDQMDIKFTLGQPFKPYEQLMGVFPAASKIHIPSAYHTLMTDEFSPIIDFYPSDFEIDMNGKKMEWQGVALLPFIDPERLLKAMSERSTLLSEDEVTRNTWGNDVMFVFEDHPLYDAFTKLYTKRKSDDKMSIDPNLSKGITGFVLPDPNCVPGSTYDAPFDKVEDIHDDRSLSALYFFPKQLTPHRSILLPGVANRKRILNQSDHDRTRRGGESSYRGGRGGGHQMGGPGVVRHNNGSGNNSGYNSRGSNGSGYNTPQSYDNNGYHNNYSGGYQVRGGSSSSSYPQQYNNGGQYDARPQQQQQGYYGGPPPPQQYNYTAPPPPASGYGGYGNTAYPQQTNYPPQGYDPRGPPPRPSYNNPPGGAYGYQQPSSYGRPPPPPQSGYQGYGGYGQGGGGRR